MFLMAEAAGNVTTREVKSLVHLFVIITYYYILSPPVNDKLPVRSIFVLSMKYFTDRHSDVC